AYDLRLLRLELDHRHRVRRERVAEARAVDGQRRGGTRQPRVSVGRAALRGILRLAVLPYLRRRVRQEALEVEPLVQVGRGILIDDQKVQPAIGLPNRVGGEVGVVAARADDGAAVEDRLRGQL